MMALTDIEIAKFAQFAVENSVPGLADLLPSRKAKLLKESKLAALSFYEKSQQDLRESGYRVTKRARNVIWRTLVDIRDRELAPSILPRKAVTNIAMTTGGEKLHPVVIMAGKRMQWVGFGWVEEGDATLSDKSDYPLVVEAIDKCR